MNKIIFIFVLALISTVNCFAAIKPGSEMVIYRFYSKGSRNKVNVAVYGVDENGRFTPIKNGSIEMTPGGKNERDADADVCETFMNDLQGFALNLMRPDGYLDDGEFIEQSRDIAKLDLDQVTFIEISEPVLRTEIAAHPELYPPHVISQRPDNENPDVAYVRKASMRIVGAQFMYPYPKEYFDQHHPDSPWIEDIPWRSHLTSPQYGTNFLDPHIIPMALTPMAWQNNPKLIELIKVHPTEDLTISPAGNVQLSLKKYPIRFELGRAGSLKIKYIQEILKAVTSVIDEDLKTMLQAHAEDAFIFVHALDEQRQGRFAKEGFEPLDGACIPGDCVMVASFTKLAATYEPGSQSARAQEIISHLGPGVDGPEALGILRRVHAYYRAELDVLSNALKIFQTTPIVMHDFSKNYYALLEIIAKRHGLDEVKSQKFAHEIGLFKNDAPLESHHLHDSLTSEPFIEEFYHRNVVRITNLDTELVANTNYIPLVVVGVYRYLNDRYNELGIRNSEEIVKYFKTQIAIQTFHPFTAMQLENYECYPMNVLQTDMGPLYTYIFDLNAIDQLKKDYPLANDAATDAVQQGIWFFRRISAHPLKF